MSEWDIVLKNQGLAHSKTNSLLKKLKDNSVRKEDLIGYAWIGLYKAAKVFDPSKGKYSTIAYHYMHRELLRGLDKVTEKGKIYSNLELESKYLDKLIYTDKYIFDELFRNEIKEAINRIDPSYRKLVIDIFYKERKYEDIGRDLGITKQAVSQKVKTALKYLSKELGVEK